VSTLAREFLFLFFDTNEVTFNLATKENTTNPPRPAREENHKEDWLEFGVDKHEREQQYFFPSWSLKKD
jgi:hypothetical protein